MMHLLITLQGAVCTRVETVTELEIGATYPVPTYLGSRAGTRLEDSGVIIVFRLGNKDKVMVIDNSTLTDRSLLLTRPTSHLRTWT